MGYGPKGSLWVAPGGTAYRYQSTILSQGTQNGERVTFKYHYFEAFPYLPNKIQVKTVRMGVYDLPDGSVKVWSPET